MAGHEHANVSGVEIDLECNDQELFFMRSQTGRGDDVPFQHRSRLSDEVLREKLERYIDK